MVDSLRDALTKPRKALKYIAKNPKQFSAEIKLIYFSRYPIGVNIFEHDWDLLIILDTCRVDALREVAPDYEFISNIGSVISRGGNTLEWVSSTFTSDHTTEIARTAYVTGNGYPEVVLEHGIFPEEHLGTGLSPTNWNTVTGGDLGLVRYVWKYAEPAILAADRKYPSTNAQTNHAIAIARENEFDRILLHYIQPHFPYIETAIQEKRTDLYEYELHPNKYLRRGGDREKVWREYIKSLRAVLDEVEVLLQNVDAERVILTADHGSAFGEYGFHGHTAGSLHPKVRLIPWVETTASDTETRQPDINLHKVEQNRATIEDHLRTLGYLE